MCIPNVSPYEQGPYESSALCREYVYQFWDTDKSHSSFYSPVIYCFNVATGRNVASATGLFFREVLKGNILSGSSVHYCSCQDFSLEVVYTTVVYTTSREKS